LIHIGDNSIYSRGENVGVGGVFVVASSLVGVVIG
jgi:hypothetical protein